MDFILGMMVGAGLYWLWCELPYVRFTQRTEQNNSVLRVVRDDDDDRPAA